MPMVTQCTAPGCETLTMGPLCVEHDVLPAREFVRGRPFTRPFAPALLDGGRLLTAAVLARPNVVRTTSVRQLAVPHHQ